MRGKERPKRRSAKPGKAKVETELPIARKSRKREGSKVRDLEKRLAEALKREAEALEQQTATSEILRVIAGSPTDVQPVVAAVAASAARLCDAFDATIFQIDGDRLRVAVHDGPIASHPVGQGPSLVRETPSGRAVLDRLTIHIADMQAASDEYPEGSENARRFGHRTTLVVPLLHAGEAIGAIAVRRTEVRPFTDRQVELLKTFADQAVIAIENVRLFTELQQKNEALTQAHAQVSESLEQQTATSEILRVISSSPTDARPVFETIVASAGRLCGAESAVVYRFEGGAAHFAAHYNLGPEAVEAYGRRFPRPLHQTDYLWRIADGSVLNSADIEQDSRMSTPVRADYRSRGARSAVWVPMVREGQALGAISVTHRDIDAFSRERVQLLKTFADQAVIAIENVRLFNETKEALERQTATAEILRVISSSPTDLQPVLETVTRTAARLCDAVDAMIFRVDGAQLLVAAHHGPIPLEEPVLRDGMPLTLATVSGRTVLEARRIHVDDLPAAKEEFPEGGGYAQRLGYRTTLSVPLLRQGTPLGAITIRRREVRPFTQNQMELLQTFADQAVIAIENVRLFTELQEKNQALMAAHAQTSEALEQQTATGEILRAISQAQTDAQPVFEVIADSVMRLFGAWSVLVFGYDGEFLHLTAARGGLPGSTDSLLARIGAPYRPTDDSPALRTVRTRTVQHIVNVEALDPSWNPRFREEAIARGFRSLVQAPMLRGDDVVGVIAVTRAQPGGFSQAEIALLQTFADQAVIAIENARLLSELQQRNEALTQAHSQVSEALEQQTATSEILRVISRSQTDVQPVFDTIVRRTVRLCNARVASVILLVDETLHLVATHAVSPEWLELARSNYPQPLQPSLVGGLALLERRTVHVPDVETDERFPRAQQLARTMGYRSLVFVPMFNEGAPIGTISAAKDVPFSEREIELLKTFADQAVIAVENVRLFTELQTSNRELTTALDKQTATSDILRVISRSQTDVQPVFDAIVASAMRLLGAYSGTLTKIAGDQIELAALTSTDAAGDAALRALFPMPLESRQGSHTQAIRTRAPFNVADAHTDPRLREGAWAYARVRGYRSQVVVPMLLHDEAIGTISVARREPGGFTDDEIALLQTFADQAVIAIENVRLFKELEARNAELTTSLDTQTATSDILRVISRSQTDVQPVFDAIVISAVRLLGAYSGGLIRLAGEQIELAAFTSTDAAGDAALRARYPRSLQSEGLQAQAIRDRAPINIADAHTDPRLPEAMHTYARVRGFRSQAVVPLLRNDEALGTISVTRREPGGFNDDEVALLQTFADQAVIAIENARLLSELQARTRELTQSVDTLTALGEVGQAISSTLDLQTVLSTIVARATQLADAEAGVIYEYDEQREVFEPRATERLEESIVQALVTTPIRKGQGATGRLAEVSEPIQLADLGDTPEQIPVRDALVRAGYRALLAVPLIREDHLIGGLTVFRKTPGEFAPDVVELLKTFATQSALAIQNARLFREIAAKSRQLEVASQHKSEFLANMSHELRTPLNAIIGFSEVLGERMFGELNAKQEEYLKDIHASGQHLLSLINDILDLSKIEAGRMELELADFHLPQAIENALVLVRERALRRGITLEQSIDPRLGEIQGDERKIKQVLLNLLSNAIKFTPEGGRVGVRAEPVDEHVEVAVSDTGVGIAPGDHEAVFEEFRQVGSAEKRAEGTGLGLALARKFIELHGGRIWVKSQVGAGSTFTFTIPVRCEPGDRGDAALQ